MNHALYASHSQPRTHSFRAKMSLRFLKRVLLCPSNFKEHTILYYNGKPVYQLVNYA